MISTKLINDNGIRYVGDTRCIGDVEISVNQRYADVCVSLQAIALHSFDGNIFLRIRKNCPSLKHTYPGSDIFAMLEYTSDHEEKHLKQSKRR